MSKDLTNLDIPVVIENKTNELSAFRYFKANFVEKLQSGDKVALSSTSSEEMAYYLKIKEDLEINEASNIPDISKYVKIVNDHIDSTGSEHLKVGVGEHIETMQETLDIQMGDEHIPEMTYNIYYFKDLITQALYNSMIGVAIPIDTTDFVLLIRESEQPSESAMYLIRGNNVTNEMHQ